MNILFMGTPDLSVHILEALLLNDYHVIGVVTRIDKQKGRGKKQVPTPVKEKALAYGLPVYQPKRVRDPEFVEKIRELAPDVIIVAAFGQIIPAEVLKLPKYGCINIHTSLLPKYRGAAPIQWAIIDGEKETGVTVMLMDEGLDTGDMLSVRKVAIDEKETGGSLFDKLAKAGAELLIETLPKVQDGSIKPIKQPSESPTDYARMIKKTDGEIDWMMPAVKIERLIRGLNPWPSAFTHLDGKLLKIWEAEVIDLSEDGKDAEGQASGGKAAERKAAPGAVVKVGKDSLCVQTGEGLLSLKIVQIEGKKSMSVGDFLRGAHVTADTILGNR